MHSTYLASLHSCDLSLPLSSINAIDTLHLEQGQQQQHEGLAAQSPCVIYENFLMNPTGFSGLAHARASMRRFAHSHTHTHTHGKRLWQSVRYFQLPNRFVCLTFASSPNCVCLLRAVGFYRGKREMGNGKCKAFPCVSI